MRKIITINFPEENEDLYEHLINKRNISRYIRELIRRDIEGWELKNVIQEIFKNNNININQNNSSKPNFNNMKNSFEKLLNLKGED